MGLYEKERFAVEIMPYDTWPLQNDMVRSLFDRLQRGEVPHAMLFVGEDADTEHFTEFLGNLLLCRGASAPCGTCEACLQMRAGTHPDFAVVRVGETGTLKAAQVEAVQEQLMLRAHAGGRTVYVLQRVDTLTPVAANRLLKTLEEPASAVVALLTARNLARVLPTIVSRCFLFRLGSSDLQSQWDDPFPALSDGKDGSAENGLIAGIFQPVVQWAERLLSGNELPVVLAESFMKLSPDIELSDMLHIFSTWLRDVMHFRAGDETHIRFQDYREDLRRQAQRVTERQLAECIRIVVQAKSRLQVHVAAQLNLEQMCIRLQEVLRCV